MKEKLFQLWIFMFLIVIMVLATWLLYEYFVVALRFHHEDFKLYYQRLQ